MKRTVSKSDFIDQFRVMNRLENFSYEARGMLFDYLEELEESCGEEMELDVVAVCCDFSEDSPEDIVSNYGIDIEGLDEEEITEAVRDYLNENTLLVGETDSGFEMIPLRCYDNGGRTWDRYTILPARWVRGWSRRTHDGLLWDAIASSAEPFHPQGIGQHVEAMAGPHLGARVAFETLPADVQRFARQSFTPEE